MKEINEIFEAMPTYYQKGHTDKKLIYYFSVGEDKWTVTVDSDSCVAQPGKQTNNADCVVKVDPQLFIRIIKEGKPPSTMDIMRGRLKSNNIGLLQKMKVFFTMKS